MIMIMENFVPDFLIRFMLKNFNVSDTTFLPFRFTKAEQFSSMNI